MDYVQGKIVEPPSNAPTATKTKYKKGEVKAKKIIMDSFQNAFGFLHFRAEHI